MFGTLFVLMQNLSRAVDDGLAPLGLSNRQWLLLAVLSKAFPGGAPTLSQAAAAYGTSRQNVKQIALQLASRGYLSLEVDSTDRRAMRLRLTDQMAIFDTPDMRSVQENLLASAFAALSLAELGVLRALVQRCLSDVAPQAAQTLLGEDRS